MPKTSVIITTHSRPHLLARAVESAKSAGTDVEVIVVDDAAAGSTAEVCRSLEGVRYVRLERNQGVAGARNVGILASSAELISFHDDDDLRLAGSLDRQVELLRAHPGAGLCYGRVIIGDGDCNPGNTLQPVHCPSGWVFWDLVVWNFIPCIATVFRRDALLRVGLMDVDIAGFDDWDMWVRIAELHSVIALEEPVAIWRAATPGSGQGSSDIAALLARVAHHQMRWLCLPTAMSGRPGARKKARQEFLDRASDLLIWNAAAWLPTLAAPYRRNGLLTAIRLNPLRALRPWTFKLLMQSIMPLDEFTCRGGTGARSKGGSVTESDRLL